MLLYLHVPYQGLQQGDFVQGDLYVDAYRCSVSVIELQRLAPSKSLRISVVKKKQASLERRVFGAKRYSIEEKEEQ